MRQEDIKVIEGKYNDTSRFSTYELNYTDNRGNFYTSLYLGYTLEQAKQCFTNKILLKIKTII